MKANMGSTDKIIRVMIALLIALLYFINVITGTVALALLAFATVFVLTSFISFCPLYRVFGISTKRGATKAH